jgi:thiamine biosynthesis lipoprotein
VSFGCPKIFSFRSSDVLLLSLVAWRAVAGVPLRYEASLDAMGSTFSVALYGEERTQLTAAADAALEEARRLDHKLSNYREESEWSTVNRFAAERDVTVSPELFNLLAACLDYSRQSEGAFDITVGPLMKVWGFYRGSGRLPHRAEIRGAMSRIGYQHLALNATARTVRFLRPGMEIDPGGIGKGYAVGRMAEILKEQGIRSAFITAGGSSMVAIGAPPGEPGWRVKIRDPKDSRKTVAEVILKDEAMSTSGSYEKFFRAEGHIYSHIMDPRTGFPAQGMYSASVIAPKAIDSEAWTKPYYILGRSWAAGHALKEFRVFLCEDKGEGACAWLR